MLEDWVDYVEVDPSRTGPGPEGAPRGDALAGTRPDTTGLRCRRSGPRFRRALWFALLGAAVLAVLVDGNVVREWVQKRLPTGIDRALELDAWAGWFTPTDDRVDVVGSGARSGDASRARRDHALLCEDVLSREAWRAEPLLAATDQLGKPWRITVHHSGGGVLTTDELAATARMLRAIQRDHQERRRWVDIGYHYIVDRAGRVWEGRPSRWVGAHAGSSGANEGNLGILVLGNFEEQSPPAAQIRALTRLVESLRRRHGIPLASVFTHAEVRATHGMARTECPGRDLAGWVARYREGGTVMVQAAGHIGD